MPLIALATFARQSAFPLALPSLIAAAPPALAEVDPLVVQAFEYLRQICAGMGIELGLPVDTVIWVDLAGNGLEDDRIIEERQTTCGMGFLRIGSGGGASVHALIGDHVQTLRGASWSVTDIRLRIGDEVLDPKRVLITGVQGAACGVSGASPCMAIDVRGNWNMVSIEDGTET